MDLFQILVHEYHHSVSVKGLNKLSENSTEYIELNRLYKLVKAYVYAPENSNRQDTARLRYMLRNLREFSTVGFTEPDAIAVLKTIPATETQSVYDVLSAVVMQVMKQQHPKTYNKEIGDTLNDLVRDTRRNTEAVQTSSQSNKPEQVLEKPNTESNETGGTSEITGVGLNSSGDVTSSVDEALEEPRESDELGEGKLDILKGVTEEIRQEERNKPFSLRNLIRAYFTQKKADASNSPLVSVKDFINTPDLITQVSKYLSDKTKVTDAHINQLKDFKRFHDQFKQNIQFIFSRKIYSSQRPQDMLVVVAY